MVESKRIDVLINGKSDLDEEVHQHETLGADLEGQDFDRVGDEKTRPSKRVCDGENPDKGDDGTACCCVAGCFLLRRADRPEDEGHAHAGGGGDEEWASAHAIDQHGAGDGDDEGENGKATVHAELGVAISDTNRLVHVRGIVGDETVSGPLGEETEGSEEEETVPVAASLEEIEIAGSLLVLVFQTESLFDLVVFELHGGVVVVAVGVVLAEDVEGFFVALLGNQPTR